MQCWKWEKKNMRIWNLAALSRGTVRVTWKNCICGSNSSISSVVIHHAHPGLNTYFFSTFFYVITLLRSLDFLGFRGIHLTNCVCATTKNVDKRRFLVRYFIVSYFKFLVSCYELTSFQCASKWWWYIMSCTPISSIFIIAEITNMGRTILLVIYPSNLVN